MRDYGFATYDPSTDRVAGVVNSKYPIFGPEYRKIAKCFKTLHITDTHTESLHTSSISMPSTSAGNTGINQYHEINRTLVATIPHGMNKRPLGYVTLAGSLVQNVHVQWAYTEASDPAGYWDSSKTLSGSAANTSAFIKGLGEYDIRLVPSVYPEITYFQQLAGYSASGTPAIDPSSVNCYYWLKQLSITIPGSGSTQSSEGILPYETEIDDENVYLYRNTAWCDVWKRSYYYSTAYYTWDLRARIKGSVDWAGSVFDMTIYLCPYSMEDLI